MQYKVKAGESWASIAGQLYGDQRQFVKIMQANPGLAYPMVDQVIEVPDQVAPNPVISQDFLSQLSALGQQVGVPLWAGATGSAGAGSPATPKPTSQLTSADSTSSYRPNAQDAANAKNQQGAGSPAPTTPAKPTTPLPFSVESGMRETLPAQWAQINTPAQPAAIKPGATNPIKPDVFNPFEMQFNEAAGMNMDMGGTLPRPTSTYKAPPPPPSSVGLPTVARPVNTQPTRLVPGTVPNVPTALPAWQRAGFASEQDYLRWYAGGPDTRR